MPLFFVSVNPARISSVKRYVIPSAGRYDITLGKRHDITFLRPPLVGIASTTDMIDIQISVNNGNEAFGTTAKTITVNEQPKNISLQFVAEELHHRMPLVPEDVIAQVLTGFQDVAARFMAEGFAIQGTNAQGDVLLRYYADARLACQSINLQKARELMPDDTLQQIAEALGCTIDLV